MYLQASNLLAEALLLLGHGALVQLSVGLHDAVLGRQHRQDFLKIKILTRERQPQSKTQPRETYICTHAQRQTMKWQTHTSKVKSQMTLQKQSQTGTSSQKCAKTTHTRTYTINAIAITTKDAERKEDNERENRTGHECLTF